MSRLVTVFVGVDDERRCFPRCPDQEINPYKDRQNERRIKIFSYHSGFRTPLFPSSRGLGPEKSLVFKGDKSTTVTRNDEVQPS